MGSFRRLGRGASRLATRRSTYDRTSKWRWSGSPNASSTSNRYAFEVAGRAKQVRWWRRSAPVPLGWPLLGTASALLLPALAGAVWSWAWYVTVAMMFPGYVAYMVLGFRSARLLEDSYVQRLPRQRILGLGASIGGLFGVSVVAVPHRLRPVVFVLVLLLVVEPSWRSAWRSFGPPDAGNTRQGISTMTG